LTIKYVAIPPLNGLVRAENRERFNAFSATDEADLKANCYKYRVHPLKGRLSAFRECHIKGNWLLIYRIIEDKLMLSLHNTGIYADLFE